MKDILRNITGTGTAEVEKQWEFFNLMDFLSDFVRHSQYYTINSCNGSCMCLFTKVCITIGC